MVGVWLLGLLFMALGVFVGVYSHQWAMVVLDTLCVGISTYKIKRYMRMIDAHEEKNNGT